MLCVLMEALGIDIGKLTEQARARPQEESGAPEPACPQTPAPPPAAAAPPPAQPGVALNYPPCMESST